MVDSVPVRAKALFVVVLVFAILYVLISPLPEMAATKAPQVLFSLVFSFFCIAISGGDRPGAVLKEHERETESRSSLDLLCSRLC
jgi:hypothetical protein